MVELLLQREADVALASEPWMQMRRVTRGKPAPFPLNGFLFGHQKCNGLLDQIFDFFILEI